MKLKSPELCQELVKAKKGAVEMPSFHIWGLEDSSELGGCDPMVAEEITQICCNICDPPCIWRGVQKWSDRPCRISWWNPGDQRFYLKPSRILSLWPTLPMPQNLDLSAWRIRNIKDCWSLASCLQLLAATICLRCQADHFSQGGGFGTGHWPIDCERLV